MRSAAICGRFWRRRGRSEHSCRTRLKRIPGRPSSPSPMPTTPLSSCPGANALVTAADVDRPLLAKGDVAVSQFEIPLPAISAFFKRARAAGATTILNPAPALAFDRELARSGRYPHPQRKRTRLAGEDRTSRYRRSFPVHRSRAIVAGRHGQNHLRHAGQARRGGAGGWRAADHFRPCCQGDRHHRRRRLLRRRGRGATRQWQSRFAMRSITPTSPPRFACSAWARRRRCRRRRRYPRSGADSPPTSASPSSAAATASVRGSA